MLEDLLRELISEIRLLRTVIEKNGVAAPVRLAPAPPPQGLIGEREVASMVGVSVSNIRRRRMLRKGPPYVKIGAAVRYRASVVREWIDSAEASDLAV